MAQSKNQNGVLSFFKRNLALFVIIACIIAIVAIVLVETNSKKQIDKLPDISLGGGGIVDVIPDDPSTDNPSTDNPSDNPSDAPSDTPTDTPVITFALPMTEYTIAMDYTSGDEFVYSSTLNEWTTHRGIDFVAKGSKDVKAVADGKVTEVTTDMEHGTKIVIDHGDGLKSIYSSLAQDPKVKKGDAVKKGDVIGQASDTGYLEFKCGPHVHFEMTKDGKHVCPRDYLDIK